LALKLRHDRLREIALNSKQIVELPIILLRPNFSHRPGIYKLRVDSNAIPSFLHAAFHDIGNTEGLPKFALVLRFPAVGRDAAAADHLQRGDIRQIGDDSFLDAIGEVRILCIVIKNIEWQDGYTFY